MSNQEREATGIRPRTELTTDSRGKPRVRKVNDQSYDSLDDEEIKKRVIERALGK